jgi:hypothetical protein
VSRRTLTLTSVTTSLNARTVRSAWRGVRMDCCTMAKAACTNTATTTGQWTAAPGRPTVRRPHYGLCLVCDTGRKRNSREWNWGAQIILCFMTTTLNKIRSVHDVPRRNSSWWARPPHYRGFTITLRHTTLGKTHLDEWSSRHRDLYLTTPNTNTRRTPMSPTGFEPAIPASHAATGNGHGVPMYFVSAHL